MEAVEVPANDEDEASEASSESDFEDLTMAQALSQLRRAPLTTLRALVEVARTPVVAPRAEPLLRPAYATANARSEASVVLPGLRRASSTAKPRESAPELPQIEDTISRRAELVQLVLRVAAFLLAWWGTLSMATAPERSEATALDPGMPYLVLGFAVWLAAGFIGWRSARVETVPSTPVSSTEVSRANRVTRLVMFAGAIALAVATALLTKGNRFTTGGTLAWIGSILLSIWAVAPLDWSLDNLRDSIKRIRLRVDWVFVALVLITIVGAYFRLHDLDLVPREMTSDHVEMLRDVHRLLNGTTEVFFASNGGREAIQFYTLALFSQIPGLSLDFYTLKLLNALEGILTIPAMYWMAKTVIGPRERRLGTLVGLLCAAFVAVSYWHVTLSRMGERIVLMPLATALFITFISRALRYNRRSDYIWAGIALGFGLYTYQAFRMVPVVILVCGLVALLFYWKRREVRHVILNFVALGVVSLIIFVPLLGFSLENPEHFWLRTTGRILGDPLIQTTDENGNSVYRSATLQERLDAFQQNVPQLMTNIRNALLMYNWKGDVAWIQSLPNTASLDPITGGLFVVGIAAWFARIFRRRDPFTVVFPVMFMIMILPSALAIAMPGENPSATRMSGTLPLTFVLVALPLAEMARSAKRLVGGVGGIAVAVLVTVGLVAASYVSNQHTYFVGYNNMYVASSYPYSEGGAYLRSFGETNSYSNAFIINRPAWWDHRAVGIEAGVLDYPNGIPSLADVPQFLQDARNQRPPYMLDVNQEILFIFAADDMATQEWLLSKFPNGFYQLIQTYQPEDSFVMFRVPPLGEQGFAEFIADAADDDLSQMSG